MGSRIETWNQASGSVGRGAGWLATVGFVLGGVAGTVDWPVVGTFFGAVEGAGVGAVAGVLVGAVLVIMTASTRSRLTVRLVSAALAGGTALAGTAAYTGPPMPRPVAVVLVVAAAVLAAWVAPLIAYGATHVPANADVATGLRRAGLRILIWGVIVGAGAGAATGLIIGVRTYLPTSPLAAVEGGVLGVVSGLVAACVVAGAVVLPQLGARR